MPLPVLRSGNEMDDAPERERPGESRWGDSDGASLSERLSNVASRAGEAASRAGSRAAEVARSEEAQEARRQAVAGARQAASGVQDAVESYEPSSRSRIPGGSISWDQGEMLHTRQFGQNDVPDSIALQEEGLFGFSETPDDDYPSPGLDFTTPRTGWGEAPESSMDDSFDWTQEFDL